MEELKDKKYIQIREIMALNLLCQIFNSKEFKDLFKKAQMIYVPNSKFPSDVKKGMDLLEMLDLVSKKRQLVKAKMKLAKKEKRSLPIEDLGNVETIQDLVAYFLTDLNQDILEELSANYLNKMYEKEKLTNRGMHSITVGIINSLLAKKAVLTKDNIMLALAMGLSHDIGHTPFGHDIESVINELVKEHTGKSFSHEQNGIIKFNKLMRRTEEQYYGNLSDALEKEGIIDYDEDGIVGEHALMINRIRGSISAHSIKKMPKEEFNRMRKKEHITVVLSRISDKIAYTVSDLRDVQEATGISKKSLARRAKGQARLLIKEYAQKHSEDMNLEETNQMFNEFTSLSLGEQAIYLVRQTNRTENGLYMNPVVWRIAKAYRKTVEKDRKTGEGIEFNKNIKAVCASAYLVWESLYLTKYKEAQAKGYVEDDDISEIIEQANEGISRLTNDELVRSAHKVVAKIRTTDEQDATRSVDESLEEKYLEER